MMLAAVWEPIGSGRGALGCDAIEETIWRHLIVGSSTKVKVGSRAGSIIVGLPLGEVGAVVELMRVGGRVVLPAGGRGTA